MTIDPKGLSRKPSSRQARESCMAGYESAKETLRVSDDDGCANGIVAGAPQGDDVTARYGEELRRRRTLLPSCVEEQL